MRAVLGSATLQRVEAKTMISEQTINNLRESSDLAIMWRNPEKFLTHRRRHTAVGEGKVAKYVLQEFVEDGDFGHWADISDLEIVDGGQAA